MSRRSAAADRTRYLAGLFDMRLPLTFSLADCAQIGDIIVARVPAEAHGRARR